MKRLSLGLPVLLAGAVFLAGGSALSPARADTTITQYDKMSKAQQANLVGSLLQSLVDGLQERHQTKEAECLTELYTNVETDARKAESPGMADFFGAVSRARQIGPDNFTIEDIIARQMVQQCNYRPPAAAKKKKKQH
jgi:hypothetical protein